MRANRVEFVTTSSIQPVPELLGSAEPVALGHQFGHLIPVGVVVEHHADDGRRPWRLVEGRPGVGQGQQLVAGRPEGQHRGWLGHPGHVAVRRRVPLLGDQDVGEGLVPDPPPHTGPGVLLVGVGQRQRGGRNPGDDVAGRLDARRPGHAPSLSAGADK